MMMISSGADVGPREQAESESGQRPAGDGKADPFETFANLCFLYIKHSFFSLVADVLAENSQLAFKHLTPVGV